MDDQTQRGAIDALRDWSKWLIGVNLFAATGCVVTLERDLAGLSKVFLILAIAAFALSVLCSALLVGLLSAVIQQLPLRDQQGTMMSIYRYSVWRSWTLGNVAQLQFMLFLAGVCSFVFWVMLS